MKKTNLVSIIIATYNRASIIEETLDSIKEQTFLNWECIIVDDGSTDNSEEVLLSYIKKDSRFKFLKRPLNVPKGPNGSRNYGIFNSKGTYVMSLDDDDWILPDHINEKVLVFEEDTTVDAVLSKTILVNDDKKIIREEKRTRLSNNLLEDFITLKISWYMHDVMWRSSFLKDKELYNQDLLKWLDRDFHIRRLIENPNIVLVNKYLSLYRIHANSNSSNSNYKVLETRHHAVIDILNILIKKQKLNKEMKLFFFKFQVQNIVVLYKSPKAVSLYSSLIAKTMVFNIQYFKWLIKLFTAYASYKIFGKGLKIIK
jgi:glycosyltransferase involved in cell wall biosynthesis